ncbi:type IV secretory system conjugative DNA transfer family protein [Streptomyces parvus]|uniref:type IV secretory system conjugative DNA transfer family protein n=1 Tax=Streptomyces parvus TaxID=66428 RepID=UPI0036AA911C
MSRPPGPVDVWKPLTILGGIALTAGGLGALSLGGALASVMTGGPWHAPYGYAFLGTVVSGDLASVWPGVPVGQVVTLAVLLVVLVLAPVVFLGIRWWKSRPDPHDKSRSLASAADVAHLTLPHLTVQAQRLRPSLAGVDPQDLAPGDVGALLGTLRPAGPVLYRSLEDVETAIMAPRSGKTSALAIPRTLDAVGWCVTTSRRADVWQATAASRAKRGPVYVFDPQSIAYHPQEWFIDLLGDIRTVEDAARLASHFVVTVANENQRDLWGPAAVELLSELMLAAALDRRDLNAVYEWVVDTGTGQPADILERHPEFASMARSYRARQGDPEETRGGVYATARIAVSCLRDPRITRWVTRPAKPMQRLDLRQFVRGTGTLYLMSNKGPGSAAPLVAALTDATIREGVRAAEAAGGRLDPGGTYVLDEAANICPIPNLPDLYSYLGGLGLNMLTIIQSLKQGESVWGQTGMAALLGASTVKIIGAGIDDVTHAGDVARLVGEHDVMTTTTSYAADGTVSRSVSPREKQIMTAAEIRAMRKGTALILATGTPVAQIDLAPYYTHHPDRELIAALEAEGKQAVQAWAQEAQTRMHFAAGSA